jgi:hypothetical protein
MVKKTKLILKNKEEVLKKIKTIKSSEYSALENGTSSYHTKYNYGKDKEFHPILDKFLETAGKGFRILDFWFNIYGPNGHVKPHRHAQENLEGNLKSGVYYIQKPINSGNIILNNKVIKIEEDDMLLFDSDIEHYSEPNKSNQDRVIFSCNLTSDYTTISK